MERPRAGAAPANQPRASRARATQHENPPSLPKVYAAVMWVVSAVFLALWIGLWAVERRPGGLVHAFLAAAICIALMNWIAHYRYPEDGA